MKGLANGRVISPVLPIAVIVAGMNLIAVPLAIQSGGAPKQITMPIHDETIMDAYYATVYGCLALAALYFILGLRGQLRTYQESPLAIANERHLLFAWVVTFLGTCAGVVAMFVQAGFQIPMLVSFGVDYVSYNSLRIIYTRAVSQSLFNVTLYLLATPNLILAWFCLPPRFRSLSWLSAALLLLVAGFTLGRSPLGLAGMMILNYRLLLGPVAPSRVLAASASAIVVLILNHLTAGNPVGYESIYDYLVLRVIYGEWLAFPTFIEQFSNSPAPLAALLHPALKEAFGIQAEAPARLAMMILSPGGVSQDRSGVANCFFLGDAYAVAGVLGVILAPVIVMLELWVVVRCFRALPKTPLTVTLFSWILFKFLMGLNGGLSAFLFSGLSLMILVLAFWVAADRLARRGLPARRAEGRVMRRSFGAH